MAAKTCPRWTKKVGSRCIKKAEIKTILKDPVTKREISTKVLAENNRIYLYPKGFGDKSSAKGHGCPLMVEIWDNELRAVIWDDINEEDPKVISLEGAKEELFKEEIT